MRNRKFHKNNKKIKKKLKNTITDSFQAKIGCKMMRKRENKNYRSVPFRSYPMHSGKLKKNSKKIKNIKKNHYSVISSQNMLKMLKKRENKNYRSVSFLLDA